MHRPVQLGPQEQLQQQPHKHQSHKQELLLQSKSQSLFRISTTYKKYLEVKGHRTENHTYNQSIYIMG
jgi:hypothetical protein